LGVLYKQINLLKLLKSFPSGDRFEYTITHDRDILSSHHGSMRVAVSFPKCKLIRSEDYKSRERKKKTTGRIKIYLGPKRKFRYLINL